MGSVGEYYACPWCGRWGNGGYSPDAVGYPICTGYDIHYNNLDFTSTYGCLHNHFLSDQGAKSKQEYDQLALAKILQTLPQQGILPILLEHLPPFLAK